MVSYTDFQIHQERYREFLQEAEQERLIRASGLRQSGNWKLPRKVAERIGGQMISWGYKLQGFDTAPSACGQVAACK